MNDRFLRVLAIEASGVSASVAIVDQSGTLAMITRADRHGHAAWITEMVDDLMNKAETGFDSITHIAAGAGPGSFTGIRVGLAAAQGYGIGLDKPVLGISSLEALGYSVLQSGSKHKMQALALIDTRRGHYFGQCFRFGASISDVLDLDSDRLASNMIQQHNAKPFDMLYIRGYGAEDIASRLNYAGLPVKGYDDSDVDADMIGQFTITRLTSGAAVEDYPPTPRYHSAPLLGPTKAR